MKARNWILSALLVSGIGVTLTTPAHDDDDDANTQIQWRYEGTLPETWAGPWHPETLDDGLNWHDGSIVTKFTDGSIRVAYVSGDPACVWEAPNLNQKVGGGRNLAQVGDEAWFKAGWGGIVYMTAGRSCEQLDIDVCTGIC